MYELIQVGERSYYIDCPVKMGIYQMNGNDVCLIDSGNDKEAGKKILKLLDQKGWNLTTIINTHSHADHIGGNHFLQQRTGCRIYAKGLEIAYTEYPVLEPATLYGGYPCKDLRHKFLMAAESQVEIWNEQTLPEGLEVIALPGHSFDMIGIRTPDQVVYLADCVSSKETLEKYQIAYLYDIGQYLSTLDQVERMEAEIFVPAHTPAVKDIRELVEMNRKKVFDIADTLQEICADKICFEDILKQLFDRYGLRMTFEQYILVGSTVKSYLSWLKDREKVDILFEDNRLLWISR